MCKRFIFSLLLCLGFIIPQLACGGGGGSDPKPIPPSTYTATFTVGAGISMSPTSYSYVSGATTPFSYTVLAGYENPQATVTSGTGSVVLVSGTAGTFTGTSNLAITVSAVPQPVDDPGAIAFVVSPEIISAMRPLVDSYMAAVAADTGCTTVLIENTTTPPVIRTQLKAITNLKCALLIGNIPIVKRQCRPVTPEWIAWEHYYSGLNFPYKDPVLDSDGYFRLPDEYRLDNHESTFPNFCQTISVSRIMGPVRGNLVADVRTYIEKNLRLRQLTPQVAQGLSYIESFEYTPAFDTALLNRVYNSHPVGAFSLLYDATGNTSKASFVSALRSADYVRVSSHGGVNGLIFNNVSSFDSRFETPSDIVARYVHVDSCAVGDIGFFVGSNVNLYGESMATRLITNGNTLLVYGATQSIGADPNSSVQRACLSDFATGIGRSPAMTEVYGHLYPGQMAFFGDPTIVMRTVSAGNQPRISVNGVVLPRETTREANASVVVSSGVAADIVFYNSGNAELEVRGSVYAPYTSTALIDRGSGGRWWVTGYTETFGTLYGAIKIAPGASRTLRVTLNRQDHGGNIASGAQEGYFHFSCNDPKVGAFRISVKGTL